MRKVSFPSILAIIFLLSAIAAGVLMTQYRQEFRLSASTDTAPKNVRIANITDTSFAVTWTTDKVSTGFVKYGESKNLGRTALDKIESPSYTHFVELTNLKIQKTYFIKINSNANDYDNNGVEWNVKTGTVLAMSPEPNMVSGTIVDTFGNAVENVLVYITSGSSSPIAAFASGNGNWFVNLSLLRNPNTGKTISVDEEDSLLEISVQAGPLGVSSAKVYPESARPVPTISLGKTHDFRNLIPEKEYEIPSATLELPEISTPESNLDSSE